MGDIDMHMGDARPVNGAIQIKSNSKSLVF